MALDVNKKYRLISVNGESIRLDAEEVAGYILAASPSGSSQLHAIEQIQTLMQRGAVILNSELSIELAKDKETL